MGIDHPERLAGHALTMSTQRPALTFQVQRNGYQQFATNASHPSLINNRSIRDSTC